MKIRKLTVSRAGTVCLSAALFCIAVPAVADTVIITTDTLINDGDTSLDARDVIVRGATLTMNGAHSLNSLSLERNLSNQPGVVTHNAGFTNGSINGLSLVIAGNVSVQGANRGMVGSRIDGDGRGFSWQQGPGAGGNAPSGYAGGGGHGGAGGVGASTNGGAAGAPYGSFTAPNTFGSGGGDGAGGPGYGGAGGGVIRLNVAGTLTVDGVISANGNPSGYYYSGGGAGGSIWIDCGTLNGTGTIAANGGAVFAGSPSGSGSGGRIAMFAGSSSFSDTNIRAYGAAGQTGGAGTVYVRPSSAAPTTLIIDNGGLPASSSLTQMTGNVNVPQNLLVRNGGHVGPAVGDASLHLTVQGNATIAGDGIIDAVGRGYPYAQGPGAGGPAPSGYAGGGGHGGAGGSGVSTNGGVSGVPYGSFTAPITMGSGGGDGAGGPGYGGAGGGALRLSVIGTLTVEGAVNANGNPSGYYYSGGGAGGSVWIDCGTLAGSGVITASGGNVFAGSPSGSGSGGRIAVFANASTFSDSNIRAYGGNGQTGGAGTVYVKLTAQSPETLIIDNGGQPFVSATTQMTGNVILPQNLLVRNGGRLGATAGDTSLHLTVNGDATIASDGAFDAENRGYPGTQGPGAGVNVPSGYAGGGGHGGAGGDGINADGSGGSTYGSFSNPITMGSGGGNGAGGPGYGGVGGGVIRMTVNGTLTVNGNFNANGGTSGYYYSGGGAGGSIWIDCGILTGSGTITANGGAVFAGSPSGSGGGGRIAIYSCQVMVSPAQVTANGGPGAQPGEAGSVFFLAASIDLLQQPQSQTILQGESAVLSVVAQSPNPLQYHWRRNGVPLADDSHVSGSLTPTLTITNALCLSNSGTYDAVVTDACGFAVTQPAFLGVRRAADINGDCLVNIDDLVQVITSWGSCPQPCPAYCPADVNQNCLVNIDDLVAVVTNWG